MGGATGVWMLLWGDWETGNIVAWCSDQIIRAGRPKKGSGVVRRVNGALAIPDMAEMREIVDRGIVTVMGDAYERVE